MIRFEQVCKRFGDHEVLRAVDLEIPRGRVHFIMGHSGAGKSVLIKQVVGLLRPNAGRIWFDGQDITDLSEAGFASVRERCQLIFQHATLFDGLTAIDNVAMPLRNRFGLRPNAATEAAHAALLRVHADAFAERFPSELGAGVRKRIAIARALALKPEVVLYDEPTTGLDPVSARRIDRLIRETSDALGLTSVVVSHDLASMHGVADHVAFLWEGRVHFQGRAAGLQASRDPILARFCGAEFLAT